ncbi:probable multidrug resistance-associated protein lethal(2)03659 [Tribolium castaneum]|uniref:Putative multidrug resistance-associated protein lethal(2)03659-like Protein n=1 Tax=Tribolium castaneum TaxID=7070 RepID=D6WJW0_TRICA|nr:PREDICTED: probable multidrug resistance-associated protein lethal(2)03659 [Tribolium castaneum]EFA03657.2 putative multidrug resistance-associated protein lethal(2)03659-like Protein [Tribolium castaneum]|eukprot:XP_973693.2 PREDICTED: probable multidrug resistance-associated protein lethal(2)03659 [Tribolium castaneum]
MESTEKTIDGCKKKTHPHKKANIISKLFFCWPLPLFVKGFRKDLTEDDLYGTLKAHKSNLLGDKLEKKWIKETNNHRNPSLWRVLFQVYGLETILYGVVLLIQELIVKMAHPMLIGGLMAYYDPNQVEITKQMAYLYSAGIIGISFLNIMIMHSYFFGLQQLGMKIRVSCCSLLYRKALRLSKSSLIDTTIGQTVNLMSNDVNRFDFLIMHIHHLVIAPLEALVVIYLLYTTVHPAALAGAGLMVIFVPLQLYLGKRTSFYRYRTAIKTDQRVRLMNEIITGIQVIKMYTWEKPFAKLVEMARKLEIHQIRASSYLKAINVSFIIFLNRTSIYLCILTYVLTGNSLNAGYVYVVTSYYGILRQSLTMFLPRGITLLAETNVSVKRIQKFLSYDEIKPQVNHPDPEKPIGVYMEDISVRWSPTTPDFTLSGVNFSVGPQHLVGVVGPVGSGKTTLLHVILKEIALAKGNLEISGRISYAAQEPWLFAASIRQNILFGEKMDREKYQQVVKVCALERDFSMFPYGDHTIVGERGVMLSGGQKARINLARAVYKDADIYLLDDPLSAVDTHVGKRLFEDCISGYLREKCTVLVTHQLQYLRNVDRIYLLEGGAITASGTFSELQNSDSEFVKLLEKLVTDEDKHDKQEETSQKLKAFKSFDKEKPSEVKEHRSVGTLSKRIYFCYLKAAGNYCLSVCILLLFVFAQMAASGTDVFVTFWVNLEQDRSSNVTNVVSAFFTPDNCIYIHSSFIVFLIVVTITRSLSFFKVCMRASRNLHNNMFLSIVHATMRFFNTNPSGRILNRFSKDMGSIDETLPQSITDTLQVGLNVFSITIVLSTINPWIIIPTVIIFAVFYMFKVIFLATSRNLKRMEGTTRSPVFSHLSQSLQGLSTIRAFNAQETLRLEFDNHQDLHSSTYHMFIATSRTFAFWLDINCILYISIVILSFLFIGVESYGGNVGLAITQSITLTGMLQWGMRQWSELENQMTSVERVIEYTELEQESDEKRKNVPETWPTSGRIEFQSVFMQYSPDDPFVLKNLTFVINSKEKIGIVGRTGAGKSSIISALFRLVPTEGNIIIDGVDINEISLHCLRSNISIIPQEPILFSGTLRKNLDPFDEYSDEQLWKALDEVKLKALVSEQPSGLASNVSEGGSNFSVGQRQLLCLARAVIRNNVILVLDEATANVDPQTDELIQNTIRRKFKECTVLTIAHRLHTVMDSDKILVMSGGRAVEFDEPYSLLQKTDGVFYGLVQQTGKGMAENLMNIANKNREYTTETDS